MRIAATLATAGLLLAAGSSAPQVADAAEPRVEPCIQPAGTGGCDGDTKSGELLQQREPLKACILPVVYRGGPLDLCGPRERPAPDPLMVPLGPADR